ncbi:MAG: O-antigen ligase family protein [Coleofasciculus sp. B1-GNL1-01]|uniref:O-antigen ligase family protein n=1 Tax=Coleofasciculus sp. B1-GNL1-01 TaxID=3068484 RepID=UPI0032F6A709
MTKVIKFHFFASTIFLSICFILQIFFNAYNTLPWVNIVLFLGLLISTIINPIYGICILVFLLPFTAGFFHQTQALFNIAIPMVDSLSLDGVIGVLFGVLLLYTFTNRLKLDRNKSWDKASLLESILIAFHLIIIITIAIAISRNLYQSVSPYSVKGFFYNLANIRYLSFHDDYFPLRDLVIFTAAITLSIRLLNLIRTPSQLKQSLLIPLAIATTIILGYALWSKLTGLGYNRDGVATGVNSFLPDIHAYGGYALAAVMGGLYYLSSTNVLIKWIAGAFSLLAVAGVVVSASRFAIVMLGIVVISYLFFVFRTKNRGKITTVILSIILVLGTAYLSVHWDNRGLFSRLYSVFHSQSFEDFNTALSQRPDIFRSNLLMYSHYPILGLGKGIFYRQSSIAEFSQSHFFAQYNGENAHNYFLQILVEMGLIGLVIFCTLFLYQGLYLRNKHTGIITLLILGLFSGNLYGHSLLLPNLLFLLFILLGASNIDKEPEKSISPTIRLIQLPKTWRYFLIAMTTTLIVGAIYEVKTSYGKLPFQSQFFCYKPAEYSDRQTSGLFKETYTVTGKYLMLNYIVHHADAQRRPLTIDFNLEQQGQTIAYYQRLINSPGEYQESLDISQLKTGSNISLQIKTSRCFTPMNLGVGLDKRPLGIQLNKVLQDSR